MRSPSVSPSNSVSCVPSNVLGSDRGTSESQPVHQPATRPSQYPPEVLWTLKDCKDDPNVKTTPTNLSRPPMEQAIHHADGNMISSGEWAAIKAMARVIKMDLLSLPTPTSQCAKELKRTSGHFFTRNG